MCNTLDIYIVYYYKWHCTIWSRWSTSYYVLQLIIIFIFVFVVLVKHEYGWRSSDNNLATHTESINHPIIKCSCVNFSLHFNLSELLYLILIYIRINYEIITTHYIHHAALNVIKWVFCGWYDDATAKTVFSFLEQT